MQNNDRCQNLRKFPFVLSFVLLFGILAITFWIFAKYRPLPNVYAAGRELNAAGNSVAVLWKNGNASHLSDVGVDAAANCVFVSGGKIYAAGYVAGDMGNNIAALWQLGKGAKDLTQQHLNDGSLASEAHSVFVSGQDVYVALEETDPLGRGTAIVWKNGAPLRLSDESRDSAAISVFVSGGHVYVVGYETDLAAGSADTPNKVAVLWKNGMAQRLSDGSYTAQAHSVYVSGDDVYIVGHEGNQQDKLVAILWKNGAPLSLSDGSNDASAYGVFVSGADVYVSGREIDPNGNWVAMLWKNGAPQRLSDGNHSAYAKAVAVSGNDVYVSGWERGEDGKWMATLWKNGVSQRLSDGDYGSYASSVFCVLD